VRYAPLSPTGADPGGPGPAADPDGIEALRRAWAERSATLGRAVRVELAAGELVGTAVDVSADGHLLVAPEGGTDVREVVVGDVVHLRTLGS
jgi:BirA family biotin operon repressor/biotin-[acetyl-CoA-carboxylase] ligase